MRARQRPPCLRHREPELATGRDPCPRVQPLALRCDAFPPGLALAPWGAAGRHRQLRSGCPAAVLGESPRWYGAAACLRAVPRRRVEKSGDRTADQSAQHSSRDAVGRWETGEWHPKHHAPAHARSLLDHCSALLRALFLALPRTRVTAPVRATAPIDVFVRRYGPKLCAQAKAVDPRCMDGVLNPATAGGRPCVGAHSVVPAAERCLHVRAVRAQKPVPMDRLLFPGRRGAPAMHVRCMVQLAQRLRRMDTESAPSALVMSSSGVPVF